MRDVLDEDRSELARSSVTSEGLYDSVRSLEDEKTHMRNVSDDAVVARTDVTSESI